MVKLSLIYNVQYKRILIIVQKKKKKLAKKKVSDGNISLYPTYYRLCESQQGGRAGLGSGDGSQLRARPTNSCSLTITEEVISPSSKNICYLLYTNTHSDAH